MNGPTDWINVLTMAVLVAGAASSLLIPLAVTRRKRQLAHFMGLSESAAPSWHHPGPVSTPSVRPPLIDEHPDIPTCSDATKLVAWMRRRSATLAGVYALSLLGVIGVLAGFYLASDLSTDDPNLRMWLGLFVGWGAFAAIMFLVLAEPTRGTFWALLLGVALLEMATSWALGANMLPLVVITTVPATMLGWIVARRSVRAVGPAIFLSVTLGFGSVLFAFALGADTVGDNPDSGDLLVIIILVPLGLLVGVGLAAAAMIGLSNAYSAHWIGDNELKALAWAFAFIWVIATLVAPGVGNSTALILLGWPAYWLLLRAELSLFPRPLRKNAPRLLFLRTFRPGSKARAALRSAEALWRTWGPVDVIAAPDVAADTFEVDELVKLVRGRTGDLFDELDLGDALAGTETEPGTRYRVIERFCTGDNWQSAVARLAGRASAILFDLRGFGAQNAGAVHEIGLILDRVPLRRVVWLVDSATDAQLLRELIASHWQALSCESPNRLERFRIKLLHADRVKRGETELIDWIAAAAMC